ncbi:MAG: SurA N-terminal domain-containing protein, partial [Rickettsiaceae bacterium]|nr:SurA N-terminal domain-containing protein [Rickettsiaceae bacterium]
MISKFRKGADSLLVRILLGLIAFSFVGVGGAAFINGNSSGDVISFSETDSISFEKFYIAKAQEIEAIQRQNGINLTEENIAELGIDNSVLKKLINDSMVDYLAKYYEFDISDEKVIAYVKKSPFFKNSNGDFDLSIFKAAFNNSRVKEEEYLASIKHQLITSAMLGTFRDSFYSPNIMTESIISYMSEARIVDVLSIDLTFKPSEYKQNDISSQQLEQFYQENKTSFVVPELRSFEYIKADRKFLEKKLNITERDIKNYYEEYKDEFESKKFSEVKEQVKEALSNEKILELSNELAKDFEEDVSTGLTL